LAQSPQWFASLSRFEHVVPLQSVGAVAGHAFLHPPGAQTGLSIGHLLPHPLQLAGLVVSVSQPSSALVVQWACPAAHAAGGMTHFPDAHATPVDVPTLASAVQSCPHAPQFFGSFAVSTQVLFEHLV
jgi:hypothetical protein